MKPIKYIFIEIDEYFLNLKNQYSNLYKRQMKYLNEVICGRKKE